jgi:hypothetical protein
MNETNFNFEVVEGKIRFTFLNEELDAEQEIEFSKEHSLKILHYLGRKILGLDLEKAQKMFVD